MLNVRAAGIVGNTQNLLTFYPFAFTQVLEVRAKT